MQIIDFTRQSTLHRERPVEYVKVCSLYGAGYYYIPGTDTCIKIGGYVRYQAYHNNVSGHYADRNAGGQFNRNTSTFGHEARFRITTDVRTQTEYGTLRSFVSFGFNWLNQPDQLNVQQAYALERAFIQFAGFTFGRADTFFGFYNGAAYGLIPTGLDGSSGPAGMNVAAYTWQLGNGLSASISLEDAGAHSKNVVNLDATNGLYSGTANLGTRTPDIVANLRVDQAWGSAQIMGALHEVGGRYYTGTGAPALTSHPDDKWGWAVGGGLTLKMPWDSKDTLSGVIAYAKGATGYVAFGNSATNTVHRQGNATGVMTDAVYNTNLGSVELTTAWGGTVAFEHYWTPSLRTSAIFGYLNVSYSDTAKAQIAVSNCGGSTVNCDPDYSLWRLASRTMWNPVRNLDVGVEVAYTKLNTAFAGRTTTLATGVANNEDQSYWSAAFRVQRNF